MLPANTNTISRVASFFGSATYTYNNRYVMNFNIRSDGANKFGSNPKYRWLPTWSIAGKWLLTNEGFMSRFADNGHYVLFGLCVAAITLSTVRLHRLPSSLTVAPVKRMRCVDLMPVGCCVWVWVGPRGLLALSGGPCRVVRRRATLPHPVGCSTIAVPGLSFRVRNGTGRLT